MRRVFQGLCAEYLARLGRVGLLEGRRCVEVVCWGLDESCRDFPLRARQRALQQRPVSLHLSLERRGHSEHVVARQLEERAAIMLGEHGDGRFQRADRLEEIFLFRIELSQV